MKIQEVAIKTTFGTLQEQDTQAERNGDRKGLKKKKPGEIVWLESAKRKPFNMLNLLSTDFSTDELGVKAGLLHICHFCSDGSEYSGPSNPL